MIKPALDEIRKLASSDMGSQEFGSLFLKSVLTTVNADAGAVWDGTSNPFQIVSQYSAGEPFHLSLNREDHDRLLGESLSSAVPIIARSAKEGVITHTGPTLLIGKYERSGTQIVELVLKTPPSNEVAGEMIQAFGNSLAIVSQSDSAFLDPNSQLSDARTAGSSVNQPSREEMGSYLSAIHGSIDRKLACANVANESRRFLDCDRISVLLKHRGKFRLFAISGQVSVNRRSNTIRLLELLSRRILKTGVQFWYPDDADIPPKISSVLDEYLGLSATRSLVVDPIYEKVEENVVDPESYERKSNRVIGGIVYEHFNEQWAREDICERVEFATLHGGNAIRNARTHHRLFLYPLWNTLGKSRILTAPRILPKSLVAIAAVACIAAFLTFWQVDFYVSADGILVPKHLQRVYAQVDGDVEQLFVNHGDAVQTNDALAILTSRDHELRIKEIESNIQNSKRRLETLEDRRFERNEDARDVQENISSLIAQIENYENQLGILNEIASQMTIRSPMSGEVISWDIERRLVGRPVQRGQILMEIAEVSGDWVLEIQLEDRRIGHLMRALDASTDRRLPVTFLLAANTSKRFSGTLVEVAHSTDVTADNQQTIKLRVEIDSDEIEINQARTGITAKIQCGRSSIGYLWLHDIKEFVQKNVYFYFS